MKRLDLGTMIANSGVTQLNVSESRTIETITHEILELKTMAGEAILGIGQRLIEAKAMLQHGEWLPWLTEQVEFSERAAQRFMKLAKEWLNPTALSDLGATKALALLALPPEEREQFITESHIIDGEEKTVIDMSARQLEQAIKERDEARFAAENAVADARVAEEARAKMEVDMAATKKLLEATQTEMENAAAAVAELENQLAELKAAPVDVAVMEVDQEALDKARAEATAELQVKLERAKKAKAESDEKRKAAEEALAETQERLEAALKSEKKAAFAADKDMATFEVLFNQTQENANKMQGLLIKARGRDNQELADMFQKAMKALAEAIGRAAE